MRLIHPLPPLYDERSRVLILGTFPSPKSREMAFFYGHPQNVFWGTLAAVLGQAEPPYDVEARRDFVLRNCIALWDVIHACDIEGSLDASIRNPEPNKFAPILAASRITTIFTTGRKGTDLFNRLCAEEAGMPSIYLPSTSPAARAAQKKPDFMERWSQVEVALGGGGLLEGGASLGGDDLLRGGEPLEGGAPRGDIVVYILECSDGTLYSGWTNDLEARVAAHNAGKGAKYTRSRLPVRLVYSEAVASRSDALKREREIKRMSRLQKIELAGLGCRS
jgi:hypoxanthine-DNA glycosylase